MPTPDEPPPPRAPVCETGLRIRRFWSAFVAEEIHTRGFFATAVPSPRPYLQRSDHGVDFLVALRQNQPCVECRIESFEPEENARCLEALRSHAQKMEEALEAEIEWIERSQSTFLRVSMGPSHSLLEEASWPHLRAWLSTTLLELRSICLEVLASEANTNEDDTNQP